MCTPSPVNSPVVGAVASPASPAKRPIDHPNPVVVKEGVVRGTGGKGRGSGDSGGDSSDRAAVAHVPKRQRVDVG